jgi:hypothetical protein
MFIYNTMSLDQVWVPKLKCYPVPNEQLYGIWYNTEKGIIMGSYYKYILTSSYYRAAHSL